MPIEIREIVIRARVEAPGVPDAGERKEHRTREIRDVLRAMLDAEAASRRRRSVGERRRAKFER